MPLFAVPIWAHQLEHDDAAHLNAHLLDQVAVLKSQLPGTVQPGQGWQTRTDLHKLEPFAGMFEIINMASRQVLDMLKVAPTPFEITGCWMNIKPRGSGHVLHGHPNNYLSGVYYVKAPKGADSIVFHDFRMNRQVIEPRYTEPTALTSSRAQVPVKTGVMIIFPSWLPHSVEPNPTQEERVSLSFNIIFSNFAETQATPHWDWAAEELAQPVRR